MTDNETTEIWTYGGDILTTGNKLGKLWIDPTGKRLIYPKKVNAHRAGDLYEARVIREGDNVSVIGTPKWLGKRNPDSDLRAQLVAASTMATQQYERKRMEKNRGDELEAALEPLRKYFSSLRTSTERRAFVSYVIDQLYRF